MSARAVRGEEPDDVASANAHALAEVGRSVDTIVAVASSEAALRAAVLKFQVEQAADKAVYAVQRAHADRLPHLQRVLQRSISLALAVAHHVLQRTGEHARARTADGASWQLRGSSGSSSGGSGGGVDDAAATCETAVGAVCGGAGAVSDRATPPPSSSQTRMMHSSSSVEDFVEGSDAWLESGALLLRTAVDLLSQALLVHHGLRRALQDYLLDHNALDYLAAAFAITRERELAYFHEGYRTEHLRLVANLVADNAAASTALAHRPHMLRYILACTRLDEDNPGAAEWAAFALRNLCAAATEAQTALRLLTTTAPA